MHLYISEQIQPGIITIQGMLKKIDCVMIRVDDLAKAREFYVRVFGMREVERFH